LLKVFEHSAISRLSDTIKGDIRQRAVLEMALSEILPVLISALSMMFTGLLWLHGRSERSDKNTTAHIEHVFTEHTQPVIDRITTLEARTSPESRDHEREAIKNIISDKLEPIQKTLSQLEIKIDVFWTNFSRDAAMILHQPDPDRHHIDVLLESYIDGTITDDEKKELKKFLYIIRNWEPGQDVGFPVHPGEQVAAAVLLRTMDYVIDATRKLRTIPEVKE
jgi:hypothetical protein